MWQAEDSLELYGIENWGNGYFSVNDKGNIIIIPGKDRSQTIDAMDIIEEIEKSKDLEFPVLLRFLLQNSRSTHRQRQGDAQASLGTVTK